MKVEDPTEPELEGIHHNLHVRLAGRLPEGRQKLLRRIDRFLARPEHEKAEVFGRASMI